MLETYEATGSPARERRCRNAGCHGSLQDGLSRAVGVVPILRAGLNGFGRAEHTTQKSGISGFTATETHEPVEYYCKLPADSELRTLLVVDPMLATGGSASDAISMIKKRGAKNVKLCCIVSCPTGIRKVLADHPDVDLYVAAIDPILNEHCYIVPGLGDAGDRLFGTK
ncbi:MAG: uracil phosphoribosyltransferase [Christensenellaceae bacterium]